MKDKNLKIIFFTITIVLIIFSIYYIIKNQRVAGSEISLKKLENKISKEIKLGITDFDTINPIQSKNQDIQYICKLIYEPIINIGQDFKLEQGLATEWSKLDEKTYLIRLNESKIWNNREKFTAKDIEYTINYIKEKESIYNDNVKNIKDIEIINDYTIKIHLKEPEEYFEYMLCFPIINEKQEFGTGSFYIKKVDDSYIVIESKENKMKLIVKIYENATKLYNAFAAGEIDIITTNNINFKEYIGTIGYNKKIIYNRNFDYLKFNVKEQEVVDAISYLINKNEIVYKIYNNIYCTGEFPLQYGSYLYNKDIEYEYNINKAKKILKEAGWENNRRYLEKEKNNIKIRNYNR